jgi:hypothetical protein
VAQKDFNYDCAKVANSKNYIHNKAVQNIGKEFEFDVIIGKEFEFDVIN